MGFLFTQFGSLKHFRQYLAGEIAHPNVWAASKTSNYYYSKINIYDVFTKELHVNEEKSRRKKYYLELDEYLGNAKPTSYESGEAGDYRLHLKIDLRKIMVGDLLIPKLLLDLKRSAYENSEYKVVIQKIIEKPEFRCDAQDNGERYLFSHLSLGNCIEVSIENAYGITNPIPDLFPYREVITLREVGGASSIIDRSLLENECNFFVRNIMKQEVALFIQEVYNLKKPKNKS